MKVSRDQFLDEGYVVVRGVVPADKLAQQRSAHEMLVDRQRAIWAAERGPDDPPGGAWEISAQPRLHLHNNVDLIDQETAAAVELWLHEGAHGVSSQLLGVEDAAVTELMMMCNPVRDHGPANWHRDLYPPYSAPIQGYADDIIEGGPRYIQWNIALYDDDVLWVVPGSHRRLNTEAENQQLRQDPRVPLPGAVQTHLSAGDGVVYILPILHWGSNYSTKKRRTAHGGFSPYTQYGDLRLLDHLSSEGRAAFERWARSSDQMKDHTESVLRAVISRDAAAFHEALGRLHPGRGEKGKILSAVYLSKSAQRIHDVKRPDFQSLPSKRRDEAVQPHPITLQWGAAFADRFTPDEAQILKDRFQPVDAAIQSDQEQSYPGVQGDPSRYSFDHMPTDFGVDQFIASWGPAPP